MTSMKGKRVLVTGATAGIGKETARQLRALGADIVIVGRNPDKTKGVRRELAASEGDGAIDHFIADLSSMEEVRGLARDFLAKYDSLDVLVNNAGALNLSRETTREGLELTFATNHLSYFLLTNLLLSALERAAPARVVNVSSDAHRGVSLDFEDLQSETRYSSLTAYSRSKLANILFTRELAARVAERGITVNSLHPGVVASSFLAKPGFWGAISAVARLFMISNEKGARTSVYLASSPEVAQVSGRYFAKSRAKDPSRAATDDVAAKRLWALSEELVGGIDAKPLRVPRLGRDEVSHIG